MNVKTLAERMIEVAAQLDPRAPEGRRVDAGALAEIKRLLGHEARQRDLLIEHLHTIQDRFGLVSMGHLAALAGEMHLAQKEVFEVARSCPHLDIVREDERSPAKLTVRVCDGLSCELAGAANLLEGLPAMLGARVRIIAVPCIGRCEKAPAVLVGRNPVAPAAMDNVAAAVRAGQTRQPARHYLDYIDYDAYRTAGGYRLFQECVSGARDVESMIRLLDHPDLRGLGGAELPVSHAWRDVRAAAPPRFMAVRIVDAGEPGTFKERVLLERDPHRFFEGMLIAAWAAGVDRIDIHLRDEYHGCREILARELGTLQLELPVAGLPQIRLRRAGSSHRHDHASAITDSIEGQRATLAHEFEPLFWIRELVERGSAWFAEQGRNGRRGLRRFSVSGRVKHPGVKLAPAGTTIQTLIDGYCGGMQDGHAFHAYLPGGASGGILPAAMNDIPLDFDTLQPYGCALGSAAVIVLSAQDSAIGARQERIRAHA